MTPVVLVPGLLCTAEVFGPQIPALWACGPVTVASTLAGETVAEIAAAVLSTAPPRFALAGTSMGGYVALEIVRQAPDRVARLALLSTSARADTPEQVAGRRALVARARAGDFAAVLGLAFPPIFHPARRHDAALVGTCVRMGLAVGVDGFARQTEAVIGRPDSRPGLAAVAVPTLVLVGDADPLTPPDRSREIAAAVPAARLVVVPDCGHAATLERPEAVTRALVEWAAGPDP